MAHLRHSAAAGAVGGLVGGDGPLAGWDAFLQHDVDYCGAHRDAACQDKNTGDIPARGQHPVRIRVDGLADTVPDSGRVVHSQDQRHGEQVPGMGDGGGVGGDKRGPVALRDHRIHIYVDRHLRGVVVRVPVAEVLAGGDPCGPGPVPEPALPPREVLGVLLHVHPDGDPAFHEDVLPAEEGGVGPEGGALRQGHFAGVRVHDAAAGRGDAAVRGAGASHRLRARRYEEGLDGHEHPVEGHGDRARQGLVLLTGTDTIYDPQVRGCVPVQGSEQSRGPRGDADIVGPAGLLESSDLRRLHAKGVADGREGRPKQGIPAGRGRGDSGLQRNGAFRAVGGDGC